ncbi:MAG: GNAT family N-acetyltransferase [Flavobacteriales bacterium]|jgi:diamine N-acetyltransferase
MISLRSISEDDFELLFEWENIEELWKVSEQTGPFSKAEIQGFMETCMDVTDYSIERLLICLDNEPIGAIDLLEYDPKIGHCNVGVFIVSPEHRGKGYAKSAMKEVIHEVKSRGYKLIKAIIYSDNEASRRLFLSLGFYQGGTIVFKSKPAFLFFLELRP